MGASAPKANLYSFDYRRKQLILIVQARGQFYRIFRHLISMLYPRLGPYSLVSHRNHQRLIISIHSHKLPHNIYLIVIFINGEASASRLAEALRSIFKR
jgi:hypothetical protein